MTSEPRGSLTTAARTSVEIALETRQGVPAMVPLPSSGPPEITRRVGSPPVWESIAVSVFMAIIVGRGAQRCLALSARFR